MKKVIGLMALAGLTACSAPENFYYEVMERGTDTVSIQVNKGNTKMESKAVAGMLRYMDGMAADECRQMGKTSASVTSQRTRRAGPYYSWIEREYQCA